MTVLKTTLAYNNLDTLEGGYGISLRRLERFAQHTYADSDVSRWLPHADQRTAAGDLTAAARMHKAVTVMMLKLEAQVIARNPDFDLQGRDFLNHIDFAAGTVDYFGTSWCAALPRASACSAMCNFCTPTARFIKCATAICSTTAQCR